MMQGCSMMQGTMSPVHASIGTRHAMHMGTYDTRVCGHRTLTRPAGKYSMTYISLVLLHWLALSHL